MASFTTSSSYSNTYVCTGFLFWGGSYIIDISLTPTIDICNVLGIGVAVIVNTSILFLYSFIFSLSLTPNLCSSSIINRPKSLNSISLLNILCVPITISISPNFSFLMISCCSFLVLNLFKTSILTGKSCILSLKLLYCWSARTVVGTKYATCFWSMTALNAALIATSVLP